MDIYELVRMFWMIWVNSPARLYFGPVRGGVLEYGGRVCLICRNLYQGISPKESIPRNLLREIFPEESVSRNLYQGIDSQSYIPRASALSKKVCTPTMPSVSDFLLLMWRPTYIYPSLRVVYEAHYIPRHRCRCIYSEESTPRNLHQGINTKPSTARSM